MTWTLLGYRRHGAGIDVEKALPPETHCPLSGKAFDATVVPYLAEDGWSYHRPALRWHFWLHGAVSPVTGRRLASTAMTLNRPLVNALAQGADLKDVECCITAEPFVRPYQLSDGFAYESSSLAPMLAAKPTSPHTRALFPAELVAIPNRALRRVSARLQGLAPPREGDDQDFDVRVFDVPGGAPLDAGEMWRHLRVALPCVLVCVILPMAAWSVLDATCNRSTAAWRLGATVIFVSPTVALATYALRTVCATRRSAA